MIAKPSDYFVVRETCPELKDGFGSVGAYSCGKYRRCLNNDIGRNIIVCVPEAQAFVDAQEFRSPLETLGPELVREAQRIGPSKFAEPTEIASVQEAEIAGVSVRDYGGRKMAASDWKAEGTAR